ncbi:MAG: hypothetical protein H8F28_15625 [Fibrella sp.]|nr:hypothetical protein [Armatimonadota bacterium]
MEKNTKASVRQDGGVISTQDILSVASGIASNGTVRRVWAESVSDNVLRERVAWSLPPEDEEEQITDAISDVSDAVPERLQPRMWALSERFVRTPFESLPYRILNVIETVLNLPCFAPAIAASDPFGAANLVSQAVMTAESVRIEFQQLPSASPDNELSSLVRIIVDASALSQEGDYSSAAVTLAEGDKSLSPLLVPLNAQARGLLDVDKFPPSEHARRLVSVSLTPK